MNWLALAKKPWRFLSVAGLFLITVSTAGCNVSPQYSDRLSVSKAEIINIDAGNITVMPPTGFCKDDRSSKSTKESVFLLFANCGYLSTNGKRSAGNAQFSGLVTANITKTSTFKKSSDINILSDFLSSNEGLKSLSSSGNTHTVSIVRKRLSSDGIYLQLRDLDASLSQNVWKSFLNRSNRLVTITFLESKDASMSQDQVMKFLQSYSKTIASTL